MKIVSNSAYTALGRTISEIKAQTRNTDSPFPDRDCNSRQGNRGQIVVDPGIFWRKNRLAKIKYSSISSWHSDRFGDPTDSRKW